MLDNSDVLNQDQQVQPDGPVQPDVEPAPEVLNQVTTSSPSKSMYTSAARPIQEKDHASEIASNAMNGQQSSATYNTARPEQKEYNTDIETHTTMSNGQELGGVFKSYYGMGDDYKIADNEDFKWNKLAAEDGQIAYDQQAAQARYESVQAKQELDKAQSNAFNNYFAAEYSARQTQDKMGWTGGQQTASDLQVQFLQAEEAANMYTQQEMQKYGVETKLGIARMYAAAEQKALALKYYQDEVNKAVQEANETGCYVPPEAREMFAQDKMADAILNDPTKSQAEKKRAEDVKRTTQKYYDSLGFEHWEVKDEKTGKVVTEYYGIKTLQKLTLEETIRNNKINEDLQRAANEAAREANILGWANLRQQEKEYEWEVSIRNQDMITQHEKEGKNVKSAGYDYYYDENNVKHNLPKDAEIKELGSGDSKHWVYIIHDGTQKKEYEVYDSRDAASNSEKNYNARKDATQNSKTEQKTTLTKDQKKQADKIIKQSKEDQAVANYIVSQW